MLSTSLSPGTVPSLGLPSTASLSCAIACTWNPDICNTINQQLAAVRRLAHEAADAGLLSPELAAGISRVKGVKQLGFRSGNWLSTEQSSEVLKCAIGDGMRAKRDYAMLAMLFGCGFRRSEHVDNLGAYTASRRRPAFSSHLITSIDFGSDGVALRAVQPVCVCQRKVTATARSLGSHVRLGSSCHDAACLSIGVEAVWMT